VPTPVLKLLRVLAWLLARLYFRIRFEGVDNVPLAGPLILVPNHVSYADPPLVSIPVGRRIFYMAWNRLFRIPVLAGLVRLLGAFPVEIDSADRQATRVAVRLLRAGQALMIFPEAGRTLDGRLQPFRLGAFRLACSHGAPIVPVTIIGGHEAWPPSRRFPRPGRVTIVYHPPIKPDPARDPRAAARELAARVRGVVASRLPPSQRSDPGD
jgi:1-acyl-sn-glycerol-3-phosphate acyltransferase